MKAVLKLLVWVSILNIAFLVSMAFAQPGPALPTDGQQAFDLFSTLWKYIVEKNWAAAAGPAITLCVWGLKEYDLKIFTALKLPKAGQVVNDFLDKPFVSFLLPTVASALAGFVTALATGHSFADALGAVWAASTTAITTYVGIKKVAEQMNAGQAAADAVKTKQDAIAELKK